MVFKRAADAPTKQRKGINKLTLGFASLAAAAVIGTTGIAAAQTQGKPSEAQCKQMGYSRQSKCLDDWGKHKLPKHNGAGYSGNTANVELNVSQSGSNNVLNIIINIFQ